MAEVYVAKDLRLGRKVALKFPRQDLDWNPDKVARFVREARTCSSLNHPNIITIHEVGTEEGRPFIAMELVEGRTMSEVLAEGPLPADQLVRVAVQIAEGLARAHSEGVVHRDLKPSNLMMTTDGLIKILDFGLARWIDIEDEGLSRTTDSDLTPSFGTPRGLLLGTVDYMSPEQAAAKPVDFRSDQFSLGTVLYLFATGIRPFTRPSNAQILTAIIQEEPEPLGSLCPSLPARLVEVISRCLSKRPEERYASTRDLAIELARIERQLSSEPRDSSGYPTTLPLEATEPVPSLSEVSPRRIRLGAAGSILAAVAAAVSIALVWIYGPARQTIRLLDPVQITTATGVEDYVTWSPSERALTYDSTPAGVYSKNWDVWIVALGGNPPVNRTADNAGEDRYPSWSPDGTQIAFWSSREGGGYYLLPVFGGRPRRVAETGLLDATTFSTFGPAQWSADGQRLAFAGISAAAGAFIEILNLGSGDKQTLPVPGLQDRPRQDLAWSPDGASFAFVSSVGLTADVTRLWLLRASDGRAIPLSDGLTKDLSPSWSGDSRTLYFVSNRGGSMDLWRQRIGRDGEPTGSPEPITAGVGMRRAAFAPSGTRLAYSKGQRVANLWRVPLLEDRPATWADAEQLTFDEAFIESIDLSPDHRRLLVSSDRAGNHDIWAMEVSGGEMQHVTTDTTPDWAPRWSPDGSQIAFYSYRAGNRDVWVMPASGGPARQLTSSEFTEASPSWSPDGKRLAFTSDRGGKADLWVISVDGGEPVQVTDDNEVEPFPLWSLDGSHLIYAHADGGLCWTPVDGGPPEIRGRRRAIYARWAPKHEELLFIGAGSDSGIWALSLDDGSERRLTDLEGRPGHLGIIALATDGESVFFAWERDLGDIWVMDAVR